MGAQISVVSATSCSNIFEHKDSKLSVEVISTG